MASRVDVDVRSSSTRHIVLRAVVGLEKAVVPFQLKAGTVFSSA